MAGHRRELCLSRLGYYVYAYVNPLDGRIFYVGKGKGKRVVSHLRIRGPARKPATTIRQIRAAGKEPQLEILAHGLRTAEAALQVEDIVDVRFLKTGGGSGRPTQCQCSHLCVFNPCLLSGSGMGFEPLFDPGVR
jgi:hypothetical protein